MNAFKVPNAKKHAASIALLIGLAAVAALLAPAEASLGNAAKLVYAHAGQAWTGIAGFCAAAIFSIAYLLTANRRHLRWADAAEKASLLWWFIHVASSLITMQYAWGGIFWQEPRFRVALTFLVLSTAIYFTALIVSRERLTAIFNVVNAAVLVVLMLVTSRVMHPKNPIYGASHALSIKLYTTALVIIFLFMLIQITRWWHEINELELRGD